MRELHLFTGGGGGILAGALLGHRCVAAVEIDAYCRRVLEARQRDGVLDTFPIHDDVRTFDGKPWRGLVDVVCGGFPCQPWSVAGKKLGADDPRHLWPEMARIVAEVRPRYVFAENVALPALEEPWRDLRRLGYRVPPALCLGADDVGAPHRRKRWWLLAADADRIQHQGDTHAERGTTASDLPADADRHGMHELDHRQYVPGTGGMASTVGGDGGNGQVAYSSGNRREQGRTESMPRGREPGAGESRGALPDPDGAGLEGQRAVTLRTGAALGHPGDSRWWATEPRIRRVAHGVASRVDRLRALGNGQVPAVAAAAWRILIGQLQ